METPAVQMDSQILGRVARIQPRTHKFVRAWLQSRTALPATVVVLLVILSAILAPWIAPHGYGTIGSLDIANRLKPPFFLEGGSLNYALGTDSLGTDILSRLIFAARVSLIVGFAAVALAGTVGVTLGLVAGYVGGWVDDLIMRLADIQLAFPPLLLAIFMMAVLGAGLWNVVIVLALSSWVSYARVVRGQVLALRAKEFVEAARTVGASHTSIMFHHILPNTFAPVIVIASFSVANAIMTEAALSFLGLGVEPSTPTWGSMLADGRDYLADAWWLAAFPGVAIVLTVLGINLLGDWLRDYLDPRLQI
ncbi:MAG: ABC transporter permease [Chloroflexi bacterium]|nr:ABC transporter permease [Chloroflexota bacterium]